MTFKDGKTKTVKTRNTSIFSRLYLYCSRDFSHCIPNARRLFPVRRPTIGSQAKRFKIQAADCQT